jgi:AraC-type DNA-binding domain-containing proteins
MDTNFNCRAEIQNSVRFGNAWEKISMKKGECWTPRRIPEEIILFIEKGCLSITINGSQNKTLNQGNMIFIPSSSSFQVKITEDMECINCYFNLNDLLSVDFPINELKQYCEQLSSEFGQQTINRSLSFFLMIMNDYFSDGNFTISFFYYKKIELFSLLLARYTKQEVASLFYPIIDNGIVFKIFIYNNFLKVKDLAEFAALANYSLSGFVKRFQRYYKESPYKWILRKKGELIFCDIQSGRMSLQEIAHKYNFIHYSHFTRFCKTQLGFTPSEILDNKFLSYPIRNPNGENVYK